MINFVMKGKLVTRQCTLVTFRERERELPRKIPSRLSKQIRNSWDTTASSTWCRGKVINRPRVRNYVRLGGRPRTISFPGETAISQREISPWLADHWPSRADRWILCSSSSSLPAAIRTLLRQRISESSFQVGRATSNLDTWRLKSSLPDIG